MTGTTSDGSRRGITRRQLLAAGAASGVGIIAAGCGGSSASSTVARSTAVAPAGSDLGAVEHVIFLMMENRSFDHYYGTYPGVRGFDDHPRRRPRRLLPGLSGEHRRVTGRAAAARSRLDTVTTDLADCTFDLTHNWGPQHLCRNGGKMDSFARVHTEPASTRARPRGPSPWATTPGPTFPTTTRWPTPSPCATATTAR